MIRGLWVALPLAFAGQSTRLDAQAGGIAARADSIQYASRPGLDPRIIVASEAMSEQLRLAIDDDASRRRVTVIGATAGVVLGGLGTAAIVLNALAPNCVTEVGATSGGSIASSHCGHRSGDVAVEVVSIAA